MVVRTEGVTIDRLTNTDETERRGSAQQTRTWIRVPDDLPGSITCDSEVYEHMGRGPMHERARFQPQIRNFTVSLGGLTLLQTALRSDSARFLRHYFEMVVAMLVGMLPLGLIYVTLAPVFPAIEHPAIADPMMAIFMTVPMVGWMRFRGHTWRQASEMTTAMLVPAIPLVAVDMWGPAHIAMILGMLGLMIYRRDEYVHSRCHNLSLPGGDR